MTDAKKKFNEISSYVLTIFLLILLSLGSCKTFDNPFKSRTVILDSANLLTLDQMDSIASLINALESKVGSQIGVVIINDLHGKKIEAYSMEAISELRLGRSTYNDGLLITVAMQDKEMRIEVGTGLENIIRDEVAARIIREVIAPRFAKGKFGLGLYVGIDSISHRIIDHKEMVGQEPRWK